MGHMRIGELFAGYGGLGMGVKAAIGGELAWVSEIDDAPSRILQHHWPDVPNLGDITQIDWANVPPVDILTGGFPCQDVSLAGRRAGITKGTRSGLWSEFAHAIDVLRPKLVVIENVRGLLSATADGNVESDPWGVGDGATRPVVNAFGVVLGDLASLGYDARWCGVRAADAGAPHGRFRVFCVAHPSGDRRCWDAKRDSEPVRSELEASQRADTDGHLCGVADAPCKPGRVGHGDDVQARGAAVGRCSHTGGSVVGDSDDSGLEGRPVRGGSPDERAAGADGVGVEWGGYEPAIRRWEHVTGRVAPTPTNGDGKNGGHRLSSRFVEWMMGLAEGHVTGVGLTRNQELKALGNGVVPQQAELAVRTLLGAA